MGAGFWISRYLLASAILFIILTVVEYSKGTTSQADILSALAWALVAVGHLHRLEILALPQSHGVRHVQRRHGQQAENQVLIENGQLHGSGHGHLAS